MSERYWITGVQLGLLKLGVQGSAEDVIKKVVDEQFIGNYRTDKEQLAFKKCMYSLVV